MDRRILSGTLALALALLGGCGDDATDTAPAGDRAPQAVERRAARELSGAPAPLAALHRQDSALLDGGVAAFRRRIEALRGYPVVVNKWGSWCGPCREEFPIFQEQAIKHGKRVAFLGVDGQDPGDGAKDLLDQFPVSYPSYLDFKLKIAAQELKAVAAFPSTVFYDKRGEIAYVKQGPYHSEDELETDIERYAR